MTESNIHEDYAPPHYVDYESSIPANPVGRPVQTFETQDGDSELEDGLGDDPCGDSHTRRSMWNKNWWQRMVVKTRRRMSLDDSTSGQDRALLPDSFSGVRKQLRERNWYSFCLFGSISSLTIIASLLVLNLTLGIATLIWPPDKNYPFGNWGKPGTGTEGLAWYPTDFLRDVVPIPCHSHNDYWRRVPLFDALRAGCTGVEADVWLFDDELYVGHNTASLTRDRTFTALYIDPLVKIIEHQNPDTEFYNGTLHGVFDTSDGQTLTLLVDVKTDGVETWPWVLKQLEPLRERGWLSYVDRDKVHLRPITVVGTGNTPFHVLTSNSTYRDAFFDAPLDQMWEDGEIARDVDEREESFGGAKYSRANVGQGSSGVSPTDEFDNLNSYYASSQFSKAVGKMRRGRLSPKQLKIIRGQVKGAHRRGLKARYWDLPAWPLGLRNYVWDILVKEGVDVLNVDDLRGASKQVW